MKLPLHPGRIRWNDDLLFYGYRWFAWVVAALGLLVAPHMSANLWRDSGLLLFLALLTVAATAMAQRYVLLVRQRPNLLLLDLLASITILWLSEGAALPFLPYALGALVLPTLLQGWMGGLIASLLFVGLDSTISVLVAHDTNTLLMPVPLAVRATLPLVFALLWILIGRIRPDYPPPPRAYTLEPLLDPLKLSESTPGQLTQLTALEPLDHPVNSSGQPLVRVHSTSFPHETTPQIERLLPTVATPIPVAHPDFAHALEQLVLSLRQQSVAELQLTTLGGVRPLNPAQQSLLLRMTQAAIQNVQQHAHAQRAQITLTYEQEAVMLVVEDDGVGLLDGTYERPGMHTLRALRYRLVEFEGQLAVFEHEHGGVTLRATLPL